jgi:golgi SNAP receptor complex member 2
LFGILVLLGIDLFVSSYILVRLIMISELLPEEKRKLHELEQQLIEFERGNTTIQASDIDMGLNEMIYRLNELDKLVLKEPKTRRDDFRRRAQHLRTTYSHIRSSLDNLVRRKDRTRYDSNKRDLFAGANHDIEGGDLEAEIAESSSLARSGKMLNEYIAIGQETLSSLGSQRERLKGIQRKAFDILSSLGVANTLMKMVERRDSVDMWIVYGGMVLILFLLGFVWFYLM